MSKRKVRTTTIKPVRCVYEDNALILTEYRRGVEVRVVVQFGGDEHWSARDVALMARKHISVVHGRRKDRLRWAADALVSLGGES